MSLDEHGENKHILELWHGPTARLKTWRCKFCRTFLTRSLKKTADGKTAVILVATSGDTGKAALEGFKDVAGTEMIVFYPENGVSPMQKRQMNTQEGENVCVCAIHGNFDDATDRREENFHRSRAQGRACAAQQDVLQCELYQLGSLAAADRLLFLRVPLTL